MDDIRDQFPMPPCYTCGRGMCEKYGPSEGYRCTSCGQGYVLGDTLRPTTDLKTASLRPLVMNIRLVTVHWIMAMEQAMETLQYEKLVLLMDAHKEWIDKVGLPIANHVGNVRRDEEPGELPEADGSDWLEKMP